MKKAFLNLPRSWIACCRGVRGCYLGQTLEKEFTVQASNIDEYISGIPTDGFSSLRSKWVIKYIILFPETTQVSKAKRRVLNLKRDC